MFDIYHQPTDRTRAIASMHKCIRSIGENVISRKKAEILATTEIGSEGRVEKKNIQGRDLLSLLIKANMASDIPDNARMTDEDIMARESKSPTFLFAGHETTTYLNNLPCCWGHILIYSHQRCRVLGSLRSCMSPGSLR